MIQKKELIVNEIRK